MAGTSYMGRCAIMGLGLFAGQGAVAIVDAEHVLARHAEGDAGQPARNRGGDGVGCVLVT